MIAALYFLLMVTVLGCHDQKGPQPHRRSTPDSRELTDLRNENGDLRRKIRAAEEYAEAVSKKLDFATRALQEVARKERDLQIRIFDLERTPTLGGEDLDAALERDLRFIERRLRESREALRVAEARSNPNSENLGAVVIQMNKLLEAKQAEVVELRKAVNQLRAENQELQVRTRVQSHRIDRLQTENVELEDQKTKILEKVELARERISGLEKEVAKAFLVVADRDGLRALKKSGALERYWSLYSPGDISLLGAGRFSRWVREVDPAAKEIALGGLERWEVVSVHRELENQIYFGRKSDEMYLIMKDPWQVWSASRVLVIKGR